MTNQIQIVNNSYTTAINILIANISISNELWSAQTFSFTSAQLFQTFNPLTPNNSYNGRIFIQQI